MHCIRKILGPFPAAQRQRGFTLVELILVVLILGTLSAIALPRFFDGAKSARAAQVEAMIGALRSGAEQAHLLWSLTSADAGAATISTTDGTVVSLWRGYPDAGNCCAAAGIEAMVDVSGFTVASIDSQRTRFSPATAPDPSTCHATYREALSAAAATS